MLLAASENNKSIDETRLMEKARLIDSTLARFGAEGNVTQIHPGPVVTVFEFEPDAGVRYSEVVRLSEDLSLAMRTESVRIRRIPGKSTIGIEVTNDNPEVIRLRELVESDEFRKSASKLTFALGREIDGRPFVSCLSPMPHLLVIGAPGTGKSMAIKCIISSMLFKATPDEVRFVIMDSGHGEMTLFSGLPHLLTPVLTTAE